MNIFENIDYLRVKPNYFDNSQFLPPANEVWGKVIFSEACVKNSVHRGGVPGPGGCLLLGRVSAPWRGVCSLKGCLVGGVVCFQGGVCSRGAWSGGVCFRGDLCLVEMYPGRLLLQAVRITGTIAPCKQPLRGCNKIEEA